MKFKLTILQVSIIILILAVIVALGIFSFLKPTVTLEKAKGNAISKVLKDERGNPLISQDEFQQYLLVNESEYQIIYQKSNDTFLISVNSAPFETIRQVAEKRFLSLISAPENIACQLKVEIVTPAFANPELLGKTFPLSFCK